MFQITTLHISIFVQVNLVVNSLHIGGLTHAAHEEQTGANYAHLDSNGEVEDDGQQECQQQHGDVALGVAHQR